MHYTWYDVEREMVREIRANAHFQAEETPNRGIDLTGFAAMAVVLSLVLVVVIPAFV